MSGWDLNYSIMFDIMETDKVNRGVLATGYMSLDEIVGLPRNPKDHALGEIEQSYGRFGYLIPVVINDDTGRLISGHGRTKGLRARKLRGEAPPAGVVEEDGVWKVPYTLVGVVEGDEEARLTEAGGWNKDILADVLSDLATEGEVGLEGVGFDLDDVDELLKDVLGAFDEEEVDEGDLEAVMDKAEELRESWGVLEGDVWEIKSSTVPGAVHRIVVGDCTDEAVVEACLRDEVVDLGLTSPPYAVGKEYEVEVSFEDHLDLISDFAEISLGVIKPGGFLFLNFGPITPQFATKAITNSDRQCVYPISKDYWRIFHEERDFDLYASRIWYKPFNKLQKPFWTYHTSIPHHQEWEYLWTLRAPGGETDQVYDWDTSVHAVWDTRERLEDKPLSRHVAAFPLVLPEWAIRAHSPKRAVVWDAFLGSGTTIVAAEYMGRIGRGTELEPKYTAIGLERLSRLGLEPRKV
jgi:DNA modification methylase